MPRCLYLLPFVVLEPFCAIFNFAHLEIEYYTSIETALNESETSVTDNCFDYFDEWEDFKKILEETLHE